MKFRLAKAYLLYFFICVLFAACAPIRNLTYFSVPNGKEDYQSTIINRTESKIQIDDLLGIAINSANPESNALLNKGAALGAVGASNNATPNREGYLVNKEGYINIQYLGDIQVKGLTTEEAAKIIEQSLKTILKSPNVIVNILNFRITVIGEVNRPGSFIIPNNKLNVLEALGMAGDMTPYGKRENVLVIREQNGVRNLARIDLNKGSVFNSAYFHLQQNDIVYISPDKAKALQASSRAINLPIYLAVASILAILVTNLRK